MELADPVMIVGDVLVMHIDDRCIANAQDLQIDVASLGLISRAHGSNWFARATDLFQLASSRAAHEPG